MNKNFDRRVFPHERAGHTSVVQMDVGQQDLSDIRD